MTKAFLIIAIISGCIGFFMSGTSHTINGAGKALFGVFMSLWFIVTLITGLEHSDTKPKH